MKAWDGQDGWEPAESPPRDVDWPVRAPKARDDDESDQDPGPEGSPRPHGARWVEWAFLGSFLWIALAWVSEFVVEVHFIPITPVPMLSWIVLVVASIVWAMLLWRWLTRRPGRHDHLDRLAP